MYQLLQYCDSSKGTPGLAEEAVLITGLAFKLIHQEHKGLVFIEGQDGQILENTLVKYLHASAATYTYQNDLALKLLGEIHQKVIQVNFYSLDFITGRCKLNHLEHDADIYLERYLRDYPGQDYKKDVCNRLFYYHLLNGDKVKAEEYRSRIQQVGSDLRDRDQEAILESRSEVMPDVRLLKARLLCDGGYLSEADSILETVDPRDLPEISHRLEYDYRKGRILQLGGHPDEAIPFLTKSFYDGSGLPYTFATRAAYSLGKIYEEKQDYPNAVLWYERCVDVFSSSHTTEGVKDSAEKGIKRARAKF
jgi:tetratricopeptide (TPR) repeat protein